MNDEKRHKNREIRIYKSLIIAAGIIVVAILLAVADAGGFDVLGLAIGLIMPAVLAFGAILVISVIGLFKGSRSTRTRILLWWACLFMFVVILEGASKYSDYSGYSEIREIVILLLGSVVLLILPTIWLRNAVRRVRGKLEND